MPEVTPLIGFLAGISFGSLCLIAFAILKSGAPRPTVSWGLLFCAATIVVATEDLIEPHAAHASAFGAVVMAGSLWPFTFHLFDLGKDRRILWTPLGVLLLCYACSHLFFPEHHDRIHEVQRLLIGAVGIGVAIVVLRSENDDLDPIRRRIRRPLVAVVGVWVALAVSIGFLAGQGVLSGPAVLLDEFGNAAMALLTGFLFLVPRQGLFAPPKRSQPPAANAEDEAILARLDTLMTVDQVWLEEGLTVGGLAALLKVPEHQLRPLINQRLGYRNFAAFINEHRLSEAKRRLRSPEHKKETVASIAYACGFGSLGPFGRAFKEETGMTPTAFRRASREKEEA